MGEQLKRKEIEELYRDALYHHLSRKEIGYLKEVEMRRRKALYDESKSC